MRAHHAFLIATVFLGPGISASALDGEQRQPEVTYHRHIAPILTARCGRCHRPGGAAPFSLLTYRAAAARAKQIAEVTRQRIMPPWQFAPGVVRFRGKEPLTETELSLIERWASTGSSEGDSRQNASALPDDVSSAGRPDLVVRLSETYTLRADGPDVFQAFALRIPGSESRYVRGITFHPTNGTVIHHADLLLDRSPRAREEIAAHNGDEGLLPRSAAYPPGFLLGWTPGQDDSRYSGDLAWRLEPGTDLIVQLHMVPSGKPEPIGFSVSVYFADRPPARAPAMLRLSRQDLAIAPGQADYVVTDAYVLPVAVDVLAIRPHAHQRATTVSARVELPDGQTATLLSIPRWDFRWQQNYELTTPLALPRGTRIIMRYVYDNSTGNSRIADPSRPVEWGPLKSNEMADLWLQVLPQRPGDLDRLVEDIGHKALLDDAVGYERLLRTGQYPRLVREDLAAIRMALGQYDLAVPHLEAAIAAAPRLATAHYNLGLGLAQAGRFDAAIDAYRHAIVLDPALVAARFNLANLLDRLQRSDEALREYRALLDRDPGHAPALNNAGLVLMRQGRLDDALIAFDQAITRQPSFADAHYNRGVLEAARGQPAGAQQSLRAALRLRPGWTAAAIRLADALIASGSDGIAEAVALVDGAQTDAATRDPLLLEMLANVYAAVGRFTEAVRAIDAALSQAIDGDLRVRLMTRRLRVEQQLSFASDVR